MSKLKFIIYMLAFYLFISSTGLFKTADNESKDGRVTTQSTSSKGEQLNFNPRQMWNPETNCLTFTIGSGTSCSWMCSFCQSNLGTTNYYFTDNVCQYSEQEGMCVGSPLAFSSYTCCAL